ncbi:MAG: hypothetical protein K0S36_350 [Nitrosospira multiformis]|jgi:hypothetical protein|nr:hypothetical protein [Nitrosospira multiformis]
MVLLERISASLIAGFAVWTVFVHILTFTECSFETLAKWSWLGFLGAAVACVFIAKTGAPKRPIFIEEKGDDIYDKKMVLGAIASALGLILVYRWTSNYLVFWFLTITYLAIARWLLIGGPIGIFQTSIKGTLNPAVLIAASFVAVYGATRGGINLDDPFQVNLIVGLLEHPSWPILRFDTMHRIPELPIMTSAYLSLTLEPLQAVLIDKLDANASTLRHLVFPSIVSFIGIVYLYLLINSLTPRWAVPTLFTFIAIVLFYATDFRMMGSFYWEYLAAGKQILVAMIIPALLWYTSRVMVTADVRDAILLASTAISASGLTPNGIFVAPLAAGLLALAHLTSDRAAIKRILLVTGCVAYPLAIGILIILTTHVTPSEVLDISGIEDDFRTVLGWDWRFWAATPLLLSAWAALPHLSSRRLILSWTLIFFLTIANPALDTFWARYLTGNLNWRLFWAFPVLLLISVALHSVIRALSTRRWMQWIAPASVVIGSIAIGTSTLAPVHWQAFGWRSDRVPMPEYEIAKVLGGELRPSDGVLAPNTISAYLTTFTRHPRPVIARPLYLIHLKKHLSLPDLTQRALLYAIVAPDQVAGGEFQNLIRHIEELGGAVNLDQREVILENLGPILQQRDIRAVAYQRNSEFARQLDRVLADEDFTNVPISSYQVWIKQANS